ncbi:hypothetical protein UFOVP53_199 [uncultured Caudovirales phage]|uniref:Uncharacterized protein n=1 Tax=uncultured Caudovirales phage TaxID=2100421 RepID=A0A6J5KUM8_9CAUD|nr:hypothetical protein UFOVP53_199 [uncultured Caudovirales phage]
MSRDELILLVYAERDKNMGNSKYTLEQDLFFKDLLTRLEDTTGFVIFEFNHLSMIATLVQKETRRVTNLNTYSF